MTKGNKDQENKEKEGKENQKVNKEKNPAKLEQRQKDPLL